jgi:hypothetical protein
MITFQQEPWSAIRDEIWPLWQSHYAEIAEDQERVPLDPDWDKYDALAAMDKLSITTARRGSDLVGYQFYVVDTHIHYRTTLFAASDLYFVHPNCRGGRTAMRLFKAAEAALALQGVVKVISNTKLAHDQGRLLRALGWREAERLFVKTPGA